MFIYSAVTWTNPKYGDVEYPDWAIGIGWFLAAVSVAMIPLVFVLVLLKKLFTGVSFRRAGRRSRAQLGLWVAGMSYLSGNNDNGSYGNDGVSCNNCYNDTYNNWYNDACIIIVITMLVVLKMMKVLMMLVMMMVVLMMVISRRR